MKEQYFCAQDSKKEKEKENLPWLSSQFVFLRQVGQSSGARGRRPACNTPKAEQLVQSICHTLVRVRMTNDTDITELFSNGQRLLVLANVRQYECRACLTRRHGGLPPGSSVDSHGRCVGACRSRTEEHRAIVSNARWPLSTSLCHAIRRPEATGSVRFSGVSPYANRLSPRPSPPAPQGLRRRRLLPLFLRLSP
jgi:hypothetical protein